MDYLFNSINTGSVNQIKESLDNGVDVNCKNHNQDTPLRIAIIKRNMKKNCDKNYLNIIKLLLNYGANPNIKSKILGSTPLLLAIYKKDYELVLLLIQNGANINLPNKLYNYPLISAAKYGSLKIVKLLLENGAKILNKNFENSTAYHEACRYNNNNIENYLTLWPVINIQRQWKIKMQKRFGTKILLIASNLPEIIIEIIVSYI